MTGKSSRVVLMLAAVMLLALLLPHPCSAYTAGDPEVRAFWVDAYHNGALNQSDVDKLLGVVGDPDSEGDIRKANCNAVFVEVRKNADAYYDSNMGEPWASNLSPAGFDALQAVISAAHDTTGGKKRIEVHAWMVTFRTGGGTVYEAHNDSPTASLTNLDNYWLTRVGSDTGAETSDKAFDPGHPLCEEYLTDVALDIVTNYDVDGIHFDYIRFTGSTQGYNPTSIARYNARYGLSGSPLSTSSQFQQWRRDQIIAFVRRVYAKIQLTKPWVLVSGSFYTGAPSPAASTHDAFKTSQAYKDFYSDWDTMMQEGIVDMAVPMTYFDLIGNYASDYTGWMNFQKDRKANRQLVVGPGIYLNYFADSVTEMQMTRNASPAGHYADGFCGYSYANPYTTNKSLSEPDGVWETYVDKNDPNSFYSKLCSTWADVPDRPWKSNPTKGHISGTVTIHSTGAWADGATVTITGPENRSMVCDGTGFYAFIDLTPGVYTVTASYSGYSDIVRTVNVAIGSVTGNMYVTDFAMGSNQPPAISNVQAANVTSSAATILWDTDQPCTSQVQYGLTTSYGATTTLNSNYVTSHSVALSGLAPSTLYHYRVISTGVYGTTTSQDYTFASNGPPSIGNVQATNVTADSATITWSTTAPSDSRVNYGTTASYGSVATSASPVTSHSITLSSLAAQTTYHFQCVSANAYGTATSGDYMFTTPQVPAETVLDDTDPNVTYTGTSWTISNPGAYPGGYDNSYRYCYNQRRTASHTAVWAPTLSKSGPYDVYIWYTSGSNRSTAAKYTVNHSGGSTTATVNQSIDPTDANGDKWTKIGSNLQFAAGSSGNITMNNVTGESSSTKVIIVDAAKFVYVGPTGDTTPPSVPQSLTVAPLSTTSTYLSWSTSTDDTAVAGYKIYRDSALVGDSVTTSFTDSGLTANTQYSYKVSAYDAVPNESAQSGAVAKYTLSQPPTGSMITCNKAAASWSDTPPFTFQNTGFGVSKVSGYKCVWDNSATHSWNDAETAWATTSATYNAVTTTQPYYFHVKGYNGDNVGNGTLDLGPYNYGSIFHTLWEAMNNPDGSGVIIDMYKPITGVFGNSFYVEEADRTRGLRVDAATYLSVGTSAAVGGRLSGSSGQRSLVDASVLGSNGGFAPLPMAMRVSTLGGASPDAFNSGIAGGNGAYNIGLLVRVVGKVKSHASGSFVLDDGSGTVTIYSGKSVSDGSFVGATGVCALENGHAIVRCRTIDDVQVYAP